MAILSFNEVAPLLQTRTPLLPLASRPAAQARARHCFTTALLCIGCAASFTLTAAPDVDESSSNAEPISLSPITVSGPSAEDPLAPLVETARQRLNDWPGSAQVIEAPTPHSPVLLGLSDAFMRAPGVFAPAAAGQLTGKLSIRGSGLASPLGARGIALLRDGLPLNQADGVVDPAQLDPFNAAYMEIYKGANALRYGAATLGGAINVVSPTGRSHPGTQLRVQAGSDRHLHTQARAGQTFANGMDAFASVSHYRTDGSVQHASQRASRFYGNLGFRTGARSEGRAHLDLARTAQETTSPLTADQIAGRKPLDDPPPLWPDQQIRTRPHVRLAYQQSFDYADADRVTAGMHYTDTAFDLTGTLVPISYHTRDMGLSLQGEINRFANAGHEFSWGLTLAQGRSHGKTSGPFLLPGGRPLDTSRGQYEDIRTFAQTAEIHLEHRYAIDPRVSLISGVQAVTAERERRIDVLRNPRGAPNYFRNVDFSRRYNGVSPKIGALWQATDSMQVFANLSRSYEPPTNLEFYAGDTTTDAQTGTTLELGMRATGALANLEVAVFHSRIRNELLSVPERNSNGDIVGYQGGNVPRTTHSGLELRVDGKAAPSSWTGYVDWAVSYTYSQFRHANDTTFGNNRLPVIPAHFGQVALTYVHPSGVFGGPDLIFSSGAYADQANTLEAPGYGIVNFTLGYAAPADKFRVFASARNLADKPYAASTQFLPVASANEAAFKSGMRRSFFVGTEIAW